MIKRKSLITYNKDINLVKRKLKENFKVSLKSTYFKNSIKKLALENFHITFWMYFLHQFYLDLSFILFMIAISVKR